jgi:hypothetical protein
MDKEVLIEQVVEYVVANCQAPDGKPIPVNVLRELSKPILRANKLPVRGFLTERTGRPFVAAQVASMLRGSSEQ